MPIVKSIFEDLSDVLQIAINDLAARDRLAYSTGHSFVDDA